MNKLKLHFCDFWSDGIFNPIECPLYKILATRFDLSLDSENPDVVFFSCFSGNNVRYNGRAKKVLFLGEHVISPVYGSDITTYDAALTHFEASEKNYYFPLWALFMNWFYEEQPRPNGDPVYFCDPDLFNGKKKRNFTAKDRKFCSLINNRDPEGNREEIFRLLTATHHVDSYGDLFNNVGGKLGGMQHEKCKLLNQYKFNISFENIQYAGYNTEKIIQPIESGSIPVYWGGDAVRKYFNPESYINIDDYDSMQSVVDRMIEINNDDDLFEHMINSKPFIEDPVEFHPETIADWLCEKLSL